MIAASRPSPSAIALVVLCAATAFGLGFGVQAVWVDRSAGGSAAVSDLLVLQLVPWWVWAALSPLIFALCGKVVDRASGAALSLHLVAAPVFAVSHAGATAAILQATGYAWTGGGLGEAIRRSVYGYAVSDLVIYGLISASFHVVLYVRQLQRSRERLRIAHAERMAAVGRLAGGVAHEFNNLMTVVGAEARLLRGERPDDDRVTRTCDVIVGATDRATEVTAKLLAFAERELSQKRRVDLEALVKQTAAELREDLPEAVELVTSSARGDTSVVVDRGQVRRALVDLVRNAAEAMPEGGTVGIATRPVRVGEAGPPPFEPTDAGAVVYEPGAGLSAGSYVCLEVADEGTGIPADHLPRIFDPFFSTKPAAEAGGLGLASVYGIAQQNSAHLRATSVPGAGTRISLLFPGTVGAGEESG